jgi:hypothetical protein
VKKRIYYPTTFGVLYLSQVGNSNFALLPVGCHSDIESFNSKPTGRKKTIVDSTTHSEGTLIEPSVPKIVRKSSPVAGKAVMSPVPASQDRCDAVVLPEPAIRFHRAKWVDIRCTYSVNRNDPRTPDENFIVTCTVESTGYGLSFSPSIA